jgi:hypothetical protein
MVRDVSVRCTLFGSSQGRKERTYKKREKRKNEAERVHTSSQKSLPDGVQRKNSIAYKSKKEKRKILKQDAFGKITLAS